MYFVVSLLILLATCLAGHAALLHNYSEQPALGTYIDGASGEQAQADSAEVTTAIVRAGTSGLKFKLSTLDSGTIFSVPCGPGSGGVARCTRTQAAVYGLGTPGTADPLWYGFAVYVDPSYDDSSTADPNGTVLFQSHTTVPDSCEDAQSPHLALNLKANGDFFFRIMWDTTQCSTPTSIQSAFHFMPFAKGVWYDFVVYLKPRYDNTGELIIWRNGQEIFRRMNAPNIQFNTVPNSIFASIGIYHSGWNIWTPTALPDVHTVYFDEFRIGDENSSYTEVDPAQGSAPALPPTFASCTVANATPNCANVTITDDGANILPASGCTGYAVVNNGQAQTVTSCTRISNYVHQACFATPALIADVLTVAYTPGNVTGADAEALATFADQTCTNQIGPPLITASTEIANSANFSPSRPASALYDGNLSDNNSAGNASITSFYVEHDLGAAYLVQNARIYGDITGSWVCATWQLEYKLNSGDSYTTAFTGQPCNANAWFTQGGNWLGRYWKLTVTGPSAGTQAFEAQLYGTQAAASEFRVLYKSMSLRGLTIR